MNDSDRNYFEALVNNVEGKAKTMPKAVYYHWIAKLLRRALPFRFTFASMFG